jgi:hypothetical protein
MLMLKNTEPTQTPSETVSYSRLSSYVECPTKYNYKYVNRIETPKVLEDYFLKGTLAHRCIEETLLGGDKDAAIEAVVPDWLLNDCKIPLLTGDSEEFDLGIDPQLLIEYGYKVGELLHRCMSSYKGDDPIRKADGSVAENVLTYPPKSYVSAYNKLGVHSLRSEIDTKAVQASLPFRRFSLANLTAQAFSYVLAFKLPGWVDEVIGVEYDLSKVPIKWDENTTWNGAIDLVVRNKQGKIILIDHKSEKRKASAIDVTFHAQLNTYARLYYEQTGVMPDYIGINHLPSGEYVIAAVDPAVVLGNFNYWESIRHQIAHDRETNTFAKQLPTKFNSPCVKRHWQSGVLTQVCPYITTCWPDYARYLGVELEPFLNEQTLQDAGI